MAEQYKSFIDQFLADEMPNYDEVGLGAAAESGDEQLDRTHKYVDEDFLEGLSDDTNEHTQGPRGGKGVIRASQRINRTAAALSDESVFADVIMELEEAKSHGFSEKREISEEEVQRYVKKLLNGGMPPVKVAAKIEKLAELLLFNKQTATDYLNRNAGLLGLAYIQPNDFMDKCPSTYKRMSSKGPIVAKSVKQIQACEGCVFFDKTAGKHCNLYRLPIVSSQNELLTVVNKMTAGVPAESKKAALVKIANKGEDRASLGHRIASERPVQKVHTSSPDEVRQKRASQAVEIDAATFTKLHNAGHSVEKIYNLAVKKMGSAKAGKAVREFIASLKQNGTKVALSQIDCTFLKNKLGVQNAIVGAAKCASCTFRQGMHCGLTGGTLVSFPGMEKQATNHKIAEGAPKDGRAMLQEYDMTAASAQPDIEINASGPARMDVQMNPTMTAGDIE